MKFRAQLSWALIFFNNLGVWSGSALFVWTFCQSSSVWNLITITIRALSPEKAWGYSTFFMLNSTEYEIYHAYNCWHFKNYDQNKFHAPVSWDWKKYNLRDRLFSWYGSYFHSYFQSVDTDQNQSFVKVYTSSLCSLYSHLISSHIQKLIGDIW